MARVTVSELLGEILRRDGSDFGPRFALTAQNGVEPIDIAKLAIACEAAFRLVLHDEEVAQWRVLGDASAHVARLLEAGDAQPLEREEEDRVAWFYE